MCVTRIRIHSQKKHRIILIGGSNIKRYVCNLKSLLSSIYELYSVVKLGSSTSELKETAKEGQSAIPWWFNSNL
jgi:hypothetical protein